MMLGKESSIIDFYQTDFDVDPNGKFKEWQYVGLLLPFVDEKRLHKALEPVYSTLILQEEERNRHDYDCLFIHRRNSCYEQFKKLYNDDNENQIIQNNSLQISKKLSGTMTGPI